MWNVERLGQGRAPVSLGSCMGKLHMMFWALFLAAPMMAPCLPAEAFSWGALAGLHGALGGVCSQFAEGWCCLPGPIGCATGPTEGRARQALLLRRG